MRPQRAAPQSQRGVAALVVVMVLFFIVSLVAAYASRNLLFEQRTSANQYRSTQALATAEAGLDWALAQLNSGRITDACQVSASATDTTFRDRYLAFASNGQITARGPATAGTYLYPTCVLDGTTWSCSCPSTTAPSLSAPTSAGTHPAFRLYFRSIPGKPRVVQVFANGCTRLEENCLKFDPTLPLSGSPSLATGSTNEGVAIASAVIALTGGITSPPVNALTVRGELDMHSSPLCANIAVAGPVFANGQPPPSPYVIHAGDSIHYSCPPTLTSNGTPAAVSMLPNDSRLENMDTDAMFAATFNMAKTTFAEQPAVVTLTCGASACGGDALRSAISMNPGRPLLIQGNLDIDTPGDIGSMTAPVLLNVTGNIDFGTVGANIYGVIYVQAANWSTAGSALVRGAVIAEGNVGGHGTPTISYDSDIVRTLRSNTGSFVRVPGSWQDF